MRAFIASTALLSRADVVPQIPQMFRPPCWNMIPPEGPAVKMALDGRVQKLGQRC
jgi:hypothetical protein